MSWFNPIWQLDTTQPLAHSPLGAIGDRTGRVELRKLVEWDKNGLIGKAKAAHASKAKQRIHSLLPISRQVFRHLQQSRAPAHGTVTWEDRHQHSENPFLPPALHCWAWRHVAWDIPLVNWGQLSQPCPLPTSWAPPACSLVGWCERQRMCWTLYKHCSAVTKTDLQYQSTLFSVQSQNIASY